MAAMLRSERGQASVELVAGVPVVLAAGAIVFQLLVLGYCSSLADGAAEAGALAAAAGRPVAPAVRAALPGWAADRMELDREGQRLNVGISAPSPLEALGTRLAVNSSVWVRTPGGG
jgi:hypothetical protein